MTNVQLSKPLPDELFVKGQSCFDGANGYTLIIYGNNKYKVYVRMERESQHSGWINTWVAEGLAGVYDNYASLRAAWNKQSTAVKGG